MSDPIMLYLVRHGEAEASWEDSLDPGLSKKGIEQAIAVAKCFGTKEQLPIYSSPLARARQTAAPLAELWQREVKIVDSLGEIPTPKGLSGSRLDWLLSIKDCAWQDLPPELSEWQHGIIQFIERQEQPAVIFSHYIAINLIVGWVKNIDRVVTFHPDNCSITRIKRVGATWSLDKEGEQASSNVL